VDKNRTAQIAGLLMIVASGFLLLRGSGDVPVDEASVVNGGITMRLVSSNDVTAGLECGASLWSVTADGQRALTADPNRVCVDGHLLWEGVTSGEYRVMTRATGFLDGDFELTVDSSMVDLETQALALAASLDGIVTDANGAVAGARVLLSDGQGTSSSETGAFSFRSVPVGVIELRAASVGVGAELTLEIPEEGLSDLSVELVETPERGLLGLRCDLVDCGCQVSDLLPGSPAAAVLEVGDCFSAVNGESVIGLPRTAIGAKLSGEVGGTISLTISGELIDFTLGSPVTFRPAR
jgi:hypothetical protein